MVDSRFNQGCHLSGLSRLEIEERVRDRALPLPINDPIPPADRASGRRTTIPLVGSRGEALQIVESVYAAFFEIFSFTTFKASLQSQYNSTPLPVVPEGPGNIAGGRAEGPCPRNPCPGFTSALKGRRNSGSAVRNNPAIIPEIPAPLPGRRVAYGDLFRGHGLSARPPAMFPSPFGTMWPTRYADFSSNSQLEHRSCSVPLSLAPSP